MKAISRKQQLAFPIALFFAGALLIMTLFLFASRTFAASAAETQNSGRRILSIYDGTVERGILTNKNTVREALKEAKIPIDENDFSEPGLDEKLNGTNYQVNIYRARPVIIIDGVIKKKIITPYHTGKQIAEDAGMSLQDEDIVDMQQSTSVLADGLAERMVVKRATPFTFVFYGKSATAYTQAKTVGEMLANKGIKMTKDDQLNVDQSTPIAAGMTVNLWRNGKQTTTVEEDIEAPVEEVRDANLPRGTKQVKEEGEKGRKTVTYEINIVNGQEVDRRTVNSVTTKEPKKRVVVIGVKGTYTTPSQNQQITWDFLIGKGLTREQTAGIMGNLMQEHGFKTSGDGLAQWTGSRQAKLQTMDDPSSIYTQLDFLWYELSGPYAKVLTNIKAQSTIEGAVIVFQNQYERCGICAENQRIIFAHNIYASH